MSVTRAKQKKARMHTQTHTQKKTKRIYVEDDEQAGDCPRGRRREALGAAELRAHDDGDGDVDAHVEQRGAAQQAHAADAVCQKDGEQRAADREGGRDERGHEHAADAAELNLGRLVDDGDEQEGDGDAGAGKIAQHL